MGAAAITLGYDLCLDVLCRRRDADRYWICECVQLGLVAASESQSDAWDRAVRQIVGQVSYASTNDPKGEMLWRGASACVMEQMAKSEHDGFVDAIARAADGNEIRIRINRLMEPHR